MPAETAIYTIRHAKTSYNTEKRYAGSIDIPLNETGVREAHLAAAKITGLKFDFVISSTMKRAIETAQILVPYPSQFIQTELCNERNFGIMEGHTWSEIQNFEPRILMIEVGNDFHTVNPKGAEPLEDVWNRAKKFRRFIFREFKGLKILVVSHGVFLQMFHGALRNSNCIESLAVYPANLELAIFCFCDKKLIDEKTVNLSGAFDEIKF